MTTQKNDYRYFIKFTETHNIPKTKRTKLCILYGCGIYFHHTAYDHSKLNFVQYRCKLCFTCFIVQCFIHYSMHLTIVFRLPAHTRLHTFICVPRSLCAWYELSQGMCPESNSCSSNYVDRCVTTGVWQPISGINGLLAYCHYSVSDSMFLSVCDVAIS